MKRLILIASLLLSVSTFAKEDTELRDAPCNKLTEACTNYIKNSAQKKSFSRDCMKPLLSGAKIDGLSVNEADIKACKIKKAELKQIK